MKDDNFCLTNESECADRGWKAACELLLAFCLEKKQLLKSRRYEADNSQPRVNKFWGSCEWRIGLPQIPM